MPLMEYLETIFLLRRHRIVKRVAAHPKRMAAVLTNIPNKAGAVT